MKKIVLVLLLLISFLAVPNVALGRSLISDCGLAVTRDVCEDAHNPAGLDCHWHPTTPHCRDYPVAAAVADNDIKKAPEIDLLGALDTIINVLFTILVIAAVIFIILGAFALLTARGEEEKIKTGRQQILYAVIAVVVALLARGIVTWIRGVF